MSCLQSLAKKILVLLQFAPYIRMAYYPKDNLLLLLVKCHFRQCIFEMQISDRRK